MHSLEQLACLPPGAENLLFSYSLNFDVNQAEGDLVVEVDGVRLFCDPKSMLYLNGTTLDYTSGLQGRGFQFQNPNASSTCGCGESFSV